MLDRSGAAGISGAAIAAPLGRRRVLFAALVVATMVGLLWLAAAAVPPAASPPSLFLVFFAVTLPWSAVGFWNAAIGFPDHAAARDPVGAVNPAWRRAFAATSRSSRRPRS